MNVRAVTPETHAALRDALGVFRGHVKDHDKFRHRLDRIESQVEANSAKIAEALLAGNLSAAAVAQQEANEYVDRVADPIRVEVAGRKALMEQAFASLDLACHNYITAIMYSRGAAA